MPKVSSEYITQKKAHIINAVIRVCEKKTVSSVIMQDIIDESGLSQGGIYRFYENIDDILVDLLNHIHTKLSLQDRIHTFQPEARSPLENCELVWTIIADHVKSHLLYHKIEFEFYLFLTNYPQRARAIWSKLTIPNPYKAVDEKVYDYLCSAAANDMIKPIIPLNQYMKYMSAIFDGILKRFFTETGYVNNIMKIESFSYDIDTMFHTAFLTSCYLLGVQNN